MIISRRHSNEGFRQGLTGVEDSVYSVYHGGPLKLIVVAHYLKV